MADQFIQVQPNSTGLKVDTTELTVNGNVVERQRIVLADPTQAEYFAAVTSAGALHVDASATTQPVSGTVAISNASLAVTGTFYQATQPVSVASVPTHPVTQSGTWTVQPGNTPNTTPWLTSTIPTTTGGLSTTKLISAATTNATSVKTSAGQVYNIQAFNTNPTSPRYLKLYNKASTPTVGTDTPVTTFLIPPNFSGFVIEVSNGIAFATGIAFAITGGIADSDATAIAAAEVAVNLQYK